MCWKMILIVALSLSLGCALGWVLYYRIKYRSWWIWAVYQQSLGRLEEDSSHRRQLEAKLARMEAAEEKCLRLERTLYHKAKVVESKEAILMAQFKKQQHCIDRTIRRLRDMDGEDE